MKFILTLSCVKKQYRVKQDVVLTVQTFTADSFHCHYTNTTKTRLQPLLNETLGLLLLVSFCQKYILNRTFLLEKVIDSSTHSL